MVVILNRNQRLSTLRCLKSLHHAAYANLTVIVVDNGSTDNSQPEINSIFPQVTVLASASNLGCSGGRNLGLQHAINRGAEYILFLDNDTEVLPDFLGYLVSAAEEGSKVGIVSSKIINHKDRSLMWMAGGRIDQKGRVTACYYGEGVRSVVQTPYDVDWVPGCVLLAKRSVVESIGYFDDAYFIYFEDIDWCLKASRNGYRIIVDPRSVVFHEASQAFGGGSSPAKRYFMTRNRLLFVSRFLKGWNRFSSILAIVLEELSSVLTDVSSNQFRLAVARFEGLCHFLVRRFGTVPHRWDVNL